MTTLKANYNLLLPDGKTEVKQGEVFECEVPKAEMNRIYEAIVNNLLVEISAEQKEEILTACLRKE